MQKKQKSSKKRIKKQSFMQGIIVLMFSQIIIKILGLVYKWYLTNKEGFGDAGNAIYSAGFSIYALLLTISSTGVPNAVSKLVSECISKKDFRGAHRIFKIALLTFGIIGIIGSLIMFLGSNYIAEKILDIKEAEFSLVALSPSIFFVAIISVFRGYFNGMQTMKATANSQTIEQFFKTFITILIVEFIFIFSKAETNLMAAGANLATTMATITSFSYLYIYYRIRRKEIGNEIITSKVYKTKNIFKTVKRILSVSIPMSLSSILSSINRNIDSSTVKRSLQLFLSQEEALKQYGILSGKVDTLISLPLSFNIAFATALVPTISYLKAKKNENEINKKVSFSLITTMIIGLPCTAGIIIFANQILNLLFPNAPEGALVLQVSAISIIFTMLSQTVNGALQGLGKIMTPAISLFIGVIVKFILNLILVPIEEIGVIGAAFATLVCHIIAFFIAFIVLKKNIELNLKFSTFVVKPLLATIAMSLCSYAIYIFISGITKEKVATIISIFVAVIIYVLSIISLKIYTEEEIINLPFGKKICKILKKFKIY